jgi:hypothetical protein
LNYLKSDQNKISQIIYSVFASVTLLITTWVLVSDLINTFNASKVESGTGLKWSLIWLLVLGVFSIALRLLIAVLVLIALLWAWIEWREDIRTILSHVRDFKLNENLMRKVAGYLYTLYFVIIVGLLAIAVPIWSSTNYGMNGQIIIFPIAIFVGLIFGLLLLATIKSILELYIISSLKFQKNLNMLR